MESCDRWCSKLIRVLNATVLNSEWMVFLSKIGPYVMTVMM